MSRHKKNPAPTATAPSPFPPPIPARTPPPPLRGPVRVRCISDRKPWHAKGCLLRGDEIDLPIADAETLWRAGHVELADSEIDISRVYGWLRDRDEPGLRPDCGGEQTSLQRGEFAIRGPETGGLNPSRDRGEVEERAGDRLGESQSRAGNPEIVGRPGVALSPHGAGKTGPLRRIAIIGTGASSRSMDWKQWPERWAIGNDRRARPYATRIYEVHDPAIWAQWCGHDFIQELNALEIPVWMREPHEAIKTARQIPVDDIAATFRDYFTSTFGYMLGLALYEHVAGEGVAEIGLYGCDLHSQTEYNIERPSVEWWLGVAHTLGVKTFIAEGSALLTSPYPARYGVLTKKARD